jgi:hypothetical protein
LTWHRLLQVLTCRFRPIRSGPSIGGFGSFPDWLPDISQWELSEGGRVRRFANPDSAAIVERLIAVDHPGRSYSYAILEAPIPVTD